MLAELGVGLLAADDALLHLLALRLLVRLLVLGEGSDLGVRSLEVFVLGRRG